MYKMVEYKRNVEFPLENLMNFYISRWLLFREDLARVSKTYEAWIMGAREKSSSVFRGEKEM